MIPLCGSHLQISDYQRERLFLYVFVYYVCFLMNYASLYEL